MTENTQPLVGGETKTLFKYSNADDFAEKCEAARREAEEMVGYPLVMKGQRQTYMKDDQGRDVFEVYATFVPAPVIATPEPIPMAKLPVDGTQV